MSRQHIIFNLDDTLIECNKYFNLVNDRFVEMISQWFPQIAIEKLKAKQLELDLGFIDRNGLTIEHLPQSFSGAYDYFCQETGSEPDGERRQALIELGYSVFRIPVEPFPFMYETLGQLKEDGHELYLHTGGEEENQRRKIAQLQLAAYFDNRIFISKHKDVQALQKIMDVMQADPSVVWMVGNSLRTDIVPGLEQGINVIYIPARSEWHYNMVEIKVKPKRVFLTLTSLNEVPGAIGKVVQEQEAPQGRPVDSPSAKHPTGKPGDSALAMARGDEDSGTEATWL